MSGASRWLDALAPLGPRSAAPVARASPSAASAALVRRTLVVRMCFPSLGGTVLAWVRPCWSGGWAAVRFRSLTHPRRSLVRTRQLVRRRLVIAALTSTSRRALQRSGQCGGGKLSCRDRAGGVVPPSQALACRPAVCLRCSNLIHTAVDMGWGTVTAVASAPQVNGDLLAALRGQLTNMRALLVLSILMTESSDEEQILRLATSAAATLGSWRVAGFVIGGAWWTGAKATGPVSALDAAWAWAYPLRSIGGPLGHLVVRAAQEPSKDEQFLAQVMAQQTGVAVSNAQLHARERDTAQELAQTNGTLEETVATLRHGMQIHERLTGVAAAGEGAAGIAAALHDLTGLPVAVEDRYGNLSAWAGPGRPASYRKPQAYDQERLLRRLMTAGRSVRDGDRVVALASPRP